MLRDGPRGRGPDPQPAGDRQVGGGVDIASQAGPGARQLDSTRTAMARGGIRSELRVERGSEREQRGGSGA